MNTEKLEKLKKSLDNKFIPDNMKDKIRAEIKKLEADIKTDETITATEVKEEVKEIEKKVEKALEVAEEKEEQAEAKAEEKKEKAPRKAREKKATQSETKTPKVEPKSTAKKKSVFSIAKEIRKDNESWEDAKERARKMMKSETTETKKKTRTETDKLLAMVRRNKEYKKLAGTSNLPKDASRRALPRGKRVSADGNVYYENRANRVDVGGFKNAYLENGGYADKGVYVETLDEEIDLTDDGNPRVIKTQQGGNKSFGERREMHGASPEALAFENGGSVEDEKFKKFINSQVSYIISLKTISQKREPIQNLLDNMEDYRSGSEIVKRITTDNLKYALQQKTVSKMNEVLRISLNALQYAEGGTIIGTPETPLARGLDIDYTGLVGETGGMSAGEMFAEGGSIENQYEGKTAKEVWNMWTLDQREHFLADHYDVLMGKDLGSKNKKFEDLAFITQMQLELHISQGQYAMGGSLGNHGLKQGDEIIKTMSGGVQKVKTKSGDIVYVNLANGYRGVTPPLPFAKGGYTNERRHVNKAQDYEVRYAKQRPNRTGYSGKRSFDDGGMIYKDLFEDYKNQPAELSEIVSAYMEKFEEGDYDYEDSKKFLAEVEVVGYTFDYGLDNEPYGLRPIGVELSQVEGYEDYDDEDAFAKGGYTNERRHVNKAQDYEVRYAKQRPNRTGYFGKRSFDNGGEISSKQLDLGYQYSFEKDEDNVGSLYKEAGVYSVIGFENGKHFSESFEKFTDAKKFYLDKKGKVKFNDGGISNGRYEVVKVIGFDKNGKTLPKNEIKVIADFDSRKEALNFVYEQQFKKDVTQRDIFIRDTKTNKTFAEGGFMTDPNFGDFQSGVYAEKGAKLDNQFSYMMLSRLQMDCDYYLGYGNRSEKVLWAGNVDDHIAEMKKLWNSLPKNEKPEWLTMKDILDYEKKMKSDNYATGGVTKNYINRNQLNTITIKKGDKKLTYKVSDVYNGAYKLEDGGNLERTAFYVSKRNVVKVQLKDGKDVKVANGYWIKKGAKPIHTSKYDDGGEVEYKGGGKTTFKEKATAIAKNFEGKKVEPKYQKEYGKTYDKAEAKEVGNKIAGSQKAKYDSKMSGGGSTKRGGAMQLAKQIRKDGESWQSALKRANEQMRNK